MTGPSLLDRLSPEDRKEVIKASVRRRYRAGETVFHYGDPGDTLHLIVKGRAMVQVDTPMGESSTLAVLGPGQSFGELALLGDGVRTASVVAFEPLETLTLVSGEVERLRTAYVAIQRFLIEGLAEQVARLTGRLMDAQFATAEQRVVRRLAEAMRLFSDSPGELEPMIPFTQQELADLAGTTRPTVNRVLRELEEAGTISLGRARVQVNDVERLQKLAR
jgi:CRP-like cAMP-binding protein